MTNMCNLAEQASRSLSSHNLKLYILLTLFQISEAKPVFRHKVITTTHTSHTLYAHENKIIFHLLSMQPPILHNLNSRNQTRHSKNDIQAG